MARWWGLAIAGCVAMPTAAVADDNCPDPSDLSRPRFEATVTSNLKSDYIYRGITLSAHRPSVSSEIELRFGGFYAATEVSSVSLPTSPTAEIALSGGYRHRIGDLCLDFGAIYYRYPKEMLDGLSTDTDYWEALLLGTYKIPNSDLELSGLFGWSPNIGKTGAWSKALEVGFAYDLTKLIKAANPIKFDELETKFSANVGRFWFGTTFSDLGGYRLPAYIYWDAGVEFTYREITLDLRYHGTNLSKENCFIFTGDPTATPGGLVNDISNPDGLRSRWCGAAIVATLSFELDPMAKK